MISQKVGQNNNFMTNTEQANSIYQQFYKLIIDAVDERELDVCKLAKKCALAAIDIAAAQKDNSEYGINLIREEIANNY